MVFRLDSDGYSGSTLTGQNFTVETAGLSFVGVGTDSNADGKVDKTTYTLNGVVKDASNFNQLMDVDYALQTQRPQLSESFYNDFSRTTSDFLLGNTGIGAGPLPTNPYGLDYNPIGAFYDSKSPAADAALGIAARTPVLLDAASKAMAATQLTALDANKDGKLSGSELTGLSAWSDLNENGVLDAGELESLAKKSITQIQAADYGFYTAGNGVVDSAAPASPAKRSDALPAAVAQRAVQAQPAAMPSVAPIAPYSNYRLARDLDNRYMIDASNWIDWSASQIKISNDKKTLVGTDGNDSFDGNYWAAYPQYFNVNLIENFLAGNGDDVMGGSVRNDKLWGGLGNDTVMGYQGDDAAYGEDGNDRLEGGVGNDTLDGGIGIDVVFGGVGNDKLYGGDGDDTLVGADSSDEASQALGPAGPDDDSILGGNGNDTVYAGLGNDAVDGGAGTDWLLGQKGDDTLFGGANNDELQGGDGVDSLIGGTGDDKLFGQTGNDVLWGGAGNDSLRGFTASNETKQTLSVGETDSDVLFGEAGADSLVGGLGDDYLDGGTENDYLEGGAGNDTLFGSAGADEFDAGEGNDYVDGGLDNDLMLGQAGDDTLNGGAGNDDLQGSAGNDKLLGDAGNDKLFGQVGNDSLWGGDGNDVMVGFTPSNDAKQTLAAGETDIDTLFGGRGADNLYGGFGDDYLDGGDDADLVVGNEGADVLFGGAGNDEMQGGDGNDRLLGEASDDRMFGQTGNDQMWGGDGNDVMLGFTAQNETKQSLLAGETDDDVMYGGAGNDLVISGVGNDRLYGEAGVDELQGGAGNDMLYGGDGNDRLFGQVGNDVIYGGAGDDLILGSTATNEAVPAAGQGDNNWLYGGAGNDSMLGGAGSDYLDGGAGADFMEGGKGNDTYIVNSVNDVILERASEGYDVVVSSANYLLNSGVEELRLLDGLDIHGTGNALDNKIIGNSRNNILDGVDGKDTMIGGAGSDTYYVDNLGDKVVEVAGEGTDTVQSSVSHVLGANVENVNLLDFSKPEKGLVDGKATLVYGYPKRNELDYMQGDALPDYLGTCALTSIANLLTQAQRPTSEGQVAQVAINNNWAVTDPAKPAYQRGGSNFADQQNILNSYGVRNDLLTGYNEEGIANLLRSGRGVILAVNAGVLWSDDAYKGNGAVNHAVTVTGAVYAEADGKLLGFYIADSGRSLVSDMTRFVGIEQFRLAANVPSAYAIYTLEPLKLWNENIDATGNELNNVITGNRGANSLSGGAGDDVLDGGAGADSMSGGLGNDTYHVENIGDAVVERANEGIDLVRSSISYTLGADLENLTLVGTAAINATGNALSNVLIGNGSSNTLTGGAGDDKLDGGAGIDSMIGGAGNDSFYVDNVSDVVSELANEGIDAVWASINHTLGSNVDNLYINTTAAVNATGNSLANTIYSGAGNNVMNGLDGTDTVSYYAAASAVTVSLLVSTAQATGGSGSDTLLGIENLVGSRFNDTLTGGATGNVLNGGAGADLMAGGSGNDVYDVDDIGDRVSEQLNQGTDLVRSGVSFTLGANVENLTLTGTGVTNGTGNALANVLTGNATNNMVAGEAGNDTLNGGGGADTLYGGTGSDTYVGSRGMGQDRIVESDTTAGNVDVLVFGAGIESSQLWFQHVGNNLEISIIGGTDKVTVQDWYAGNANQVEQIKTSDSKTLLNSDIDKLVQAMASFAPPASGQTTLSVNYQATLGTVLAANWH